MHASPGDVLATKHGEKAHGSGGRWHEGAKRDASTKIVGIYRRGALDTKGKQLPTHSCRTCWAIEAPPGGGYVRVSALTLTVHLPTKSSAPTLAHMPSRHSLLRCKALLGSANDAVAVKDELDAATCCDCVDLDAE